MAGDFWVRAQEGEQKYWGSDRARRDEGDPEERRPYWNPYLDIVRRHRPFRAGWGFRGG